MLTQIRWLLCCLIFFSASCKTKNSSYKTYVPTKADTALQIAVVKRAYESISTIKDTVRDGDIITRTGNDYTSESLRSLNQRDKTYSHCGIASIEHDSVFVYHAIGGDFNPDQKLRRDALEIFAEPYSNKGMGIFRFRLADSTRQNFVSEAKRLYAHGTMFDMDFDLKTDDRMYCAEFVYKCFLKASNNKLVFNHSHIKLFEFIGVDDIFLHPKCEMRARLLYK